MAIRETRDVMRYAHVREDKPSAWIDVGLSARTPVSGAKEALLLVRRIDGQLQKWVFSPGAMYWIAEAGLFIRGGIITPVPDV